MTVQDLPGARPRDRVGDRRRADARLWLAAAFLAASLHGVGVAVALVGLRPADEADALGTAALQIGLELTAPHREPEDLPPGPEADASSASTAATVAKEQAEQLDLPREQPTQTDEADRAVAPDRAKPKEDEPTVKQVQSEAAADSAASEAAATPSVETARESPASTAPVLGSGDSARLVRTTWQKQLVAHLNRFKRYPATSSQRFVQIVVAFTLDRLGHVKAARVQQGSGDPAFDRAALAMLEKADPVPPPPAAVADDGLSFSMPVIFRKKGT